MKNYNVYIFICLILLSTGCTKNFDEINTNPNLINEISPGTLLNEIIYNMTANNLTNHYEINCQLMQVQLSYPKYYGGIQRYEILETTGNSQWNSAYKWGKNLKEMINASEIKNEDNYLAIALTLNSWIFSNLTDTFGDVPFTEASQAETGIYQAKYDRQEDIYTKILADLEKANKLYDHSKPMTYGTDILFQNNTKKWQKFTNSLRLRLLLRTTNVTPASYNKIVELINDPVKNPIITQSSDAAVLYVTGITPNLSPWSRALDFTSAHVISDYFVEKLNQLNDPRRAIYANKAFNNTTDIGFKGIPSGYDETNFTFSPSYMNNLQVVAPMIIPILTFAEVEFILSELGQKGYWKNPEIHYKNAVKAAVELWTKKPLEDSYFNNPHAVYDGSLERIFLHKYLSLYFTDNQQWAEYRRTGFPILPKTKSMLNSRELPRRLLYPDVQKIYNATNYKLAANQIGGDDINSRVWWDKKMK